MGTLGLIFPVVGSRVLSLDSLSGELQPSLATPDDTGTARRTPILAAVLSLLTSGVGQLYNGQAAKGFAFYAGQILLFAALGVSGLFFTFWGSILALFVCIFMNVATIVEAARTARKLGTIVPKRYNRW